MRHEPEVAIFAIDPLNPGFGFTVKVDWPQPGGGVVAESWVVSQDDAQRIIDQVIRETHKVSEGHMTSFEADAR